MNSAILALFGNSTIKEIRINEEEDSEIWLQNNGAIMEGMNYPLKDVAVEWVEKRIYRIGFTVGDMSWAAMVRGDWIETKTQIAQRVGKDFEMFEVETDSSTGVMKWKYLEHIPINESFQRTVKRCKAFKEELMMKTWHPTVIERRLVQGREDLIWN